MKIFLGTKSLAKKKAVEIALNKLGINDNIIDGYKALSNVRDNPINEETKIGAINRNISLKQYCKNNNLTYDLLISIEAGYTKEEDNYYLDTYTCVTKDNRDYIEMGPRLKITKTIFEYVEKQNMLHELINDILGYQSINGVIGFLTDDVIKRSDLEAYSVMKALSSALKIKNNDDIDFEKYIIEERLELLNNIINERM